MTSKLAIGLVFFSTLITSGGQILFKFASQEIFPLTLSSLLNHFLIGGAILYALGAIILIISLKYGELSVLYPIYATSYIWVSLLSPVFFQDEMNLFKWMGIFIIIIGIYLVGKGGRKI